MRTLVLLLCVMGVGCRTVRPAWHIEKLDEATQRATTEGEVVGGPGKFGGHAWLGIPFAEPPVGELRWRAPRPALKRNFPLAATHFARACVQPANALTINEKDEDGIFGSEDCLYLNVWAPPVAEHLPVMVWIHGGGNSTGSAAGFDLSRLATKENVVAVSLQYRLGPLGWMRHPALREGAGEEDASGNYGTLDLIRALQWLKENAKAFGGDPERITVFGESAGATNVYSLLVSPKAAQLFQRAIAQSPSISRTTLQQAEEPDGRANNSGDVHLRLLTRRGARDRDDAKAKLELTPLPAQAATLRALSPAELMSLYKEGAPMTAGMLDMPLLFPDGVVLPQEPWVTAFGREGGWNRVPVITGTNRDEARLFQLFDSRFTYMLLGFLPRIRDEAKYEATASAVSRLWRGSCVEQVAQAMRRSGADAVWSYRFDWDEEPTRLGTELSKLLGAGHGVEIPFVMGNFEGQELLYQSEDNQPRDALSERMMDHWGSFAHSGKPGSDWLPFDVSSVDAPKHLTFDTPVSKIRMSNQTEDPEAVLQQLLADRSTPWPEKCEGLSRLVKFGFLDSERAGSVMECRSDTQ